MAYRPRPNRDRALRQLQRHQQRQPDGPTFFGYKLDPLLAEAFQKEMAAILAPLAHGFRATK